MRVLPENYNKAYDLIRADAGRDPVLVFVSTGECDSVAALKILLQIFDSDSIVYSVFPVAGYEDLQAKCDKALTESEEGRTIILVNCGGTEDVRNLLNLEPTTRVFIIDSHRPLDLTNVHQSNGQVFVLQDEVESAVEAYPEPEGGSESDSDDGGSDSEGEGSEAGDENEPPSQRQRTGGDGEAAKGMSTHRQKRLKKREAQRERYEYYNRGAYFGKAAGRVMYDLGAALGKVEGGDALWLSIVSLTDQYAHHRISHERYVEAVFEMEQRVNSANSGSNGGAGGGGGGGGGGGTVQVEGGAEVRLDEHLRIRAVEEFRLMLLAHWSLYDAMLYSPYVATAIHTWKDVGRKNVELLLATIGLPMAQCQQKYAHMKPHLKEQLVQKMAEVAPRFGLTDVRFWTFRRMHGYKHHISASDVVYGVTALLESPEQPDGGSGGGGGGAHAGTFWRALAALSHGGWQQLMHGVDLSMRLQRVIVEQGGLAIVKKSFRSGSRFRAFDLGASGFTDSHHLLGQPLALSKLCAFVMDALLHMGLSSKPIVIHGPVQQHESHDLVVGFTGRPRLEDARGNRFGISFRRAADATNAEYKHDGFSSVAIQVARADVKKFLNELQSDLDAC